MSTDSTSSKPGIVTLASSGSEGGADIGAMRLAQTAGNGVLPGVGMENTFLAQVCVCSSTCFSLLSKGL